MGQKKWGNWPFINGKCIRSLKNHKKHHANNNGLKKFFFYDLARSQGGKAIPYLFSVPASLPAESSPRSAKRNEIWQMDDVFHFAEFRKLKFVHQPYHWLIFASTGQLLWVLKSWFCSCTFIGNNSSLHKWALIMPSHMSSVRWSNSLHVII